MRTASLDNMSSSQGVLESLIFGQKNEQFARKSDERIPSPDNTHSPEFTISFIFCWIRVASRIIVPCGSPTRHYCVPGLNQCFRSESAWIRIKICLLDPDSHGQMRIQIQEVKKPRKCSPSLGEYRTGDIKARILL